jgi:hypothetical protein
MSGSFLIASAALYSVDMSTKAAKIKKILADTD